MSDFIIENDILIKYTGNGGHVVIPDNVKTIGKSAFHSCTSLISMQIPNSIKKIEKSAFYSCTGLTSVQIPDGVTEIGVAAFSNCINLTSVQIPNSITKIEKNAFYGCTGLTSVQIPDNVTEIKTAAFTATNLKEVSLPESCQLSENPFPKKTRITYRKKQNTLSIQTLSAPRTITIKLEEVQLINGVDINALISHYPPETRIILKLEKSVSKIRKTICTFSPLTKAEIQKLAR